MHSDGLSSRWSLDEYQGLITRHPAVIAGVLYRDCLRGRDDATIVVMRAASREASAMNERTWQPNAIARRPCRAYEEQIAALTDELAETNHGVVALYAELDDNAVAAAGGITS